MALIKEGHKPRQLKQKQYVYDLVKNVNCEKRPDIQVVLLEFVEGVGFKGDVASVRPEFARRHLLLPKLAVYASPENIAKYAIKKDPSEDQEKKSLSSAMAAKFISRSIVAVTMNMDVPWTIEKFHVKVALRKAGIYVAEEAIELPTEPIKGPNPDLEGKMFLVNITINGKEKVISRCRVHHWTSDITRMRPMNWEKEFISVFPQDEELIKSIPSPPQFEKKERL
ncbi:hypothetical protein CHUAL_000957 [Chamberlinius hualienensis]